MNFHVGTSPLSVSTPRLPKSEMHRGEGEAPCHARAVKAAWVESGGPKPGVKRGCDLTPVLFPCGDLMLK